MGNEELNKDDTRVTQLLHALPRVDAPADFDFRVRARIAAGNASVPSSGWLTPVRVAVPAVLFLVIGGFVAFNAFTPVDDGIVATSADARPINNTAVAHSQPATTGSPETTKGSRDESDLRAATDKIIVQPPEVDARIEERPKISDPSGDRISPGSSSATGNRDGAGGGSIDSASKASKRIYPRGLDPNVRSVEKPRDFENPVQISAKDILSAFGVDVVYSASGWKVESVKQNSTAERAGIKTGDVVETINDQKINEKTSFRGKFSGKSLRLKRGTENVDIDLRKP